MSRVHNFQQDPDEMDEQFVGRRRRHGQFDLEGSRRRQPLTEDEARELGRKPRRPRQIARHQIYDLSV